MKFEFGIGDIVRLTGNSWKGTYDPNKFGDTVTIVGLNEDGDPQFIDSEGDKSSIWVSGTSDYSAELVVDMGKKNPTDFQMGSLEAVVQNIHCMLEGVEARGDCNTPAELALYLEGAMDALGIPVIVDAE